MTKDPPHPKVREYVRHAAHWLGEEALADHTGLHVWAVRSMIKNVRGAGKGQGLDPMVSQRLLLLTDPEQQPPGTPEMVITQTVVDLSVKCEVEACLVRDLLLNHRRFAPDIFELVALGGGKMRRIPDALRQYIRKLYQTRKMSSYAIAAHLQESHGVVLTNFGIRKVLSKIGVQRRDKAQATLLAVHNLTPKHEKWLVNVYQSADSMSIPLVRASFEAAHGFKVSPSTVVRVLERYNVAIRGSRKDTTSRDRKHHAKLMGTLSRR